jgi:hypothetical protein
MSVVLLYALEAKMLGDHLYKTFFLHLLQECDHILLEDLRVGRVLEQELAAEIIDANRGLEPPPDGAAGFAKPVASPAGDVHQDDFAVDLGGDGRVVPGDDALDGDGYLVRHIRSDASGRFQQRSRISY